MPDDMMPVPQGEQFIVTVSIRRDKLHLMHDIYTTRETVPGDTVSVP